MHVLNYLLKATKKREGGKHLFDHFNISSNILLKPASMDIDHVPS